MRGNAADSGNPTGVSGLSGQLAIGPFNLTFNGNGSADVGYQLVTGDMLWFTSSPIFFSVTPEHMFLYCKYNSVGAGSIDLEVSAAFVELTDNPYT